ncbi:hypothetical protein BANRA_03397 [Pseudomonas aeruginosa]|nr:hypothetical protein BANRA_03397 [Pseudomonas aeruginosa]
MSPRFKGSDLRPVLTEAIASQCRVILVKDQGVYFLAEQGERRPDGRVKLLAMPSAATRIPTRSTTGGNWRAPNWAATTSGSTSTRRTAYSRASCTPKTT